jgi:tetratricopeptide (TPR) repeat protein
MKAAAGAILAGLLLACTTPLEQGERRYREGDRLGALELWRSIPEDASDRGQAHDRIVAVEGEFERLVEQYKQRARYHEDRGQLAESILDYRLALELQPEDEDTLHHVQILARELAARVSVHEERYAEAFAARDLPRARGELDELRKLDPFDPELQTDERHLEEALQAEVESHMANGRRRFARADYATATREFRAVLTLDPANESARGYLSYIASIRRERQEHGAPVAFDPPGEETTDERIRAEGFHQIALAAEREGDRFAAIRYALQALEADAEHEAARSQLARLRRELSVEVPALVEAGRIAFRSEDLQSALDVWRRALLVDPKNERIIAYIGRAEQQLQNLERLRAAPDVSSRTRP